MGWKVHVDKDNVFSKEQMAAMESTSSSLEDLKN